MKPPKKNQKRYYVKRVGPKGEILPEVVLCVRHFTGAYEGTAWGTSNMPPSVECEPKGGTSR